MAATFAVVTEDLMLETLPLSFPITRVIFAISVVGTIDQAEVGSGLRYGFNSKFE